MEVSAYIPVGNPLPAWIDRKDLPSLDDDCRDILLALRDYFAGVFVKKLKGVMDLSINDACDYVDNSLENGLLQFCSYVDGFSIEPTSAGLEFMVTAGFAGRVQ